MSAKQEPRRSKRVRKQGKFSNPTQATPRKKSKNHSIAEEEVPNNCCTVNDESGSGILGASIQPSQKPFVQRTMSLPKEFSITNQGKKGNVDGDDGEARANHFGSASAAGLPQGKLQTHHLLAAKSDDDNDDDDDRTEGSVIRPIDEPKSSVITSRMNGSLIMSLKGKISDSEALKR